MTAKEYLRQAYRLDQRVNSKIAQLSALRDLATRCTSSITGMPKSPNRDESRVADTVAKIVDLEDEINRDIDRLVNLRREIAEVVDRVENPVYRALLESRYLCFETWERIAENMHYDPRYLHKLHNRALAEVKIPGSP